MVFRKNPQVLISYYYYTYNMRIEHIITQSKLKNIRKIAKYSNNTFS